VTGLDIVSFVFMGLGIAFMWAGILLQMLKDQPSREDARLLIGIGLGIIVTAGLMFTTVTTMHEWGYDLSGCVSYQVLIQAPKH